MTSSSENDGSQIDRGAAMLKSAPRTVLIVALLSTVLFLSVGRFDWPAAWALVAIVLAYYVAAMCVMEPELIIERLAALERRDGREEWDMILSFAAAYAGPPSAMIVAGLDVRYGWSSFPVALQIVGGIVMAAGFALSVWAAGTNRFFSAVVRIQRDRGHHVISGGPYRFVRHPGYVGFSVFAGVTPVLLGSWWGLIPGAAAVGLIVLRTALEDRALRRELGGYQDYAAQVKYRLLPGVW